MKYQFLEEVQCKYEAGFTLVELSIALVIIGLIVGGVLVGQDLIRAAYIRATISQIEKYNAAVNTFYGKYQALPGDMNARVADTFGFSPRGNGGGQGDGDGIIRGNQCNFCDFPSGASGFGETTVFWVDLSTAGLIDGGFNTASEVNLPGSDITGTSLMLYLPQAKLGGGNYIYVYSSDYFVSSVWNSLGFNFFGISAVTNIAYQSNQSKMSSTANIPVAYAYAMDSKLDDGLPQSGRVMAWYVNIDQFWTDGTDASATIGEPIPYSGGLPGSSTTCYDNGGTPGATTTYSMNQSNGAGANCALSFRFQ